MSYANEEIYQIPNPPIYMGKGRLLTENTFCGIDVETTGVDPLNDRIVSIACRKIVKGEPQEPKYFVVNPEMVIPPAAAAVHGFSNYIIDQMNAPTLDTVIDEIVEYVGDAIIVAHNAAFDRSFVNPPVFLENGYTRVKWFETPEQLEWKAGFNGKGRNWLCTYRLAHHLFKAHYGYSDIVLNNEALRFWLEPQYVRKGDAHNALHDINTTLHNLMHILSYAEFTLGIDTIEQLFNLQFQSIAPKEIPFGKHRGVAVTDAPSDYLEWCLQNGDQFGLEYEMGLSFAAELERRNKINGHFDDKLVEVRVIGSLLTDDTNDIVKKQTSDLMSDFKPNNEKIVPKAEIIKQRIKDVTKPQPKSAVAQPKPKPKAFF